MSSAKYKTDGHPVPIEPGEIGVDEASGDGARVRVVDRPGTVIADWDISPGDRETWTTLFEYHRGQYPEDDAVVLAIYEDSLEGFLADLSREIDVGRLVDVLRALEVEKVENQEGGILRTYAFPESRLGRA